MLVILGLPPNVEVAKLLKTPSVGKTCILASRKDLAKVFRGNVSATPYCELRSITAKSVVSK